VGADGGFFGRCGLLASSRILFGALGIDEPSEIAGFLFMLILSST
jgi:hypothetical protein